MTKKINPWFLISVAGLTIFSLFNIFGIDKSLFINQLVFFILGLSLAFLFIKIGLKFFRMNSKLFFFLFIFLTILTFFIGENIRGSRRWINLFFFNFQPSEFLKIFFVIYLADFFSKNHKLDSKTILKSFLYFFVPAIIIFKQPDLGNSLVFVFVFLTLLFFAGLELRYFIGSAVFFLVSAPILWKILAVYQKNRLLSFLNPQFDRLGVSYNLVQSVITLGSGGLWGRGLGLGTQARFAFLPENHTDFVFASLVEQFGFIGGFVTLFLYGVIIYQLFRKLRGQDRTGFNFLFLTGVIVILSTEIFINIGMNLGILPVTGIALPLISYGGSSIVSTLFILSLAISI